ncbi:MAG: hypothetical protein KatS3mg097_556 [Candidatus Parcubacteria bacterium]|nr:MAG: hypothetical protein KatS3mg097_556 [Candidatus Parcubacteria bacterium]
MNYKNSIKETLERYYYELKDGDARTFLNILPSYINFILNTPGLANIIRRLEKGWKTEEKKLIAELKKHEKKANDETKNKLDKYKLLELLNQYGVNDELVEIYIKDFQKLEKAPVDIIEKRYELIVLEIANHVLAKIPSDSPIRKNIENLISFPYFKEYTNAKERLRAAKLNHEFTFWSQLYETSQIIKGGYSDEELKKLYGDSWIIYVMKEERIKKILDGSILNPEKVALSYVEGKPETIELYKEEWLPRLNNYLIRELNRTNRLNNLIIEKINIFAPVVDTITQFLPYLKELLKWLSEKFLKPY